MTENTEGIQFGRILPRVGLVKKQTVRHFTMEGVKSERLCTHYRDNYMVEFRNVSSEFSTTTITSVFFIVVFRFGRYGGLLNNASGITISSHIQQRIINIFSTSFHQEKIHRITSLFVILMIKFCSDFSESVFLAFFFWFNKNIKSLYNNICKCN